MRICIIGSCGKMKKSSHPKSPSCSDIDSKDDLSYWQKELDPLCHPAFEMYTGHQNRELVQGVRYLREIEGIEVDLYIISAGFGLLEENELVPPYDCTFSGMKKKELLERAMKLDIPHDFHEKCANHYDLMYLALGKNYFISLGPAWLEEESACVVQFVERNVPPVHVWLPSNNAIVKAFSLNGHKIHGATGFKGDLLRILARYALARSDPYGELIGWTEPSYLQQLFVDLYSSKQSTLKF